jgi:hypothetical protein
MSLRSNFTAFGIVYFAISLLCLSSCEKYNQVDNSSTVKTPYILFMGGYHGTVSKTNDALYYNSLHSTDDAVIRQIIVADSNILYLKDYLYISKDNGKSFPRSSGIGALPYINELKKYYLPNTGLYTKNDTFIYMCTNTNGVAKGNVAPLMVSGDRGKSFVNAGAPISPTSITQLKNGDLYIIQDSANIYKKQGNGAWTQVAQNATNPLGRDTTQWYITHKGDTLLVIDYNGKQGVYYSSNGGLDWTPCTGNPKKKKILFGNQLADNNSFYIGYDSAGVYKLDGAVFTKVALDIDWRSKVGFIEGKTVTYRNGFKRNYLFAATDRGLYYSENDGDNWRVINSGSFSTLR